MEREGDESLVLNARNSQAGCVNCSTIHFIDAYRTALNGCASLVVTPRTAADLLAGGGIYHDTKSLSVEQLLALLVPIADAAAAAVTDFTLTLLLLVAEFLADNPGEARLCRRIRRVAISS